MRGGAYEDVSEVDGGNMNTFEKLHRISTLLADSKVKETLEYYNEPSDNAPLLTECIQQMESLISSFPDDIQERYRFEITGLKNQISTLKKGRYYERLQRSGIPLISTVGERIKYSVALLQIAAETNQPGFLEQYK